jgi:negative regulator of flagellin synthesis FlgM
VRGGALMTERIGNSNINIKSYIKTLETKEVRSASNSKVTRQEGQQDKITFSPKAKEVAALAKKLQGSPELRAQKIADLKAQIDAGEYHVDFKAIAEKMLHKGKEK